MKRGVVRSPMMVRWRRGKALEAKNALAVARFEGESFPIRRKERVEMEGWRRKWKSSIGTAAYSPGSPRWERRKAG